RVPSGKELADEAAERAPARAAQSDIETERRQRPPAVGEALGWAVVVSTDGPWGSERLRRGRRHRGEFVGERGQALGEPIWGYHAGRGRGPKCEILCESLFEPDQSLVGETTAYPQVGELVCDAHARPIVQGVVGKEGNGDAELG